MQYDLGPTRERQTMEQQLRRGRTMPGTKASELTFRSTGTTLVQNPLATILRTQDSLRLSAIQADSIASMNRAYTYRVDSIWTPVARYLAALPTEYSESEAFDRYMAARRAQFALLAEIGPVVRQLLTGEQVRKLPTATVAVLDPRYLASVRHGTGLYVGGGSGLASGGGLIGGESFVIMTSVGGAGGMVIVR
jgi:hypothetical protein